MENDNEKIGFIILRYVNSELTNNYWIYCYDCIRQFYPENSIIIIDDNSDYDFITDKNLYKTTIIQSEYPRRGELLPYYYYSNNNFFDIAVIIHDSVFINKYLDFNVDKYKMLWDFDHSNDQIEDETKMIKIFNNKDLLDFYSDKSLWRGCFGGMSVITYNYLQEINKQYEIKKLLDFVLTRYNRMSFERVIGCLLQMKKDRLIASDSNVYFDDINKYINFGINFYEKEQYNNLPVIKIWTGR